VSARGARRAVPPGRPSTDGPLASAVPVACLLVFVVAWTALAIAPRFRADWLLENYPTFLALPAVLWGYRRFRFSDRAYVQGTAFVLLHTIGSHYTYSEVPFGDVVRDAFGLARNHYDRLVHFAFGLLMLRPVRELGFRRGIRREPGELATLYFSVAGVALWSAVYEIAEWLTARVVDPAAGTAFLGTQGDPWDAEKDMTCALAGAVLAAGVEAWLDRAASRGGGRRAHRWMGR
jgi:putative membrane protein